MLKNALPNQYLALIDFDSIELTKESFIGDKLKSFWFDMVVKVKVKNKDAKITFLIEHKASYDRFTLFQMLEYLVQIWDDDIKNKNSYLTPIIPVLIFHGRSKWNNDRKLDMCFQEDLLESFLKFIPNFDYILFDLNQVKDEELIGNIEYIIAIKIMKYIHKDLLKAFRDALSVLSDYLKTHTLNDNLRSFLDTLIEYINKSEDIEPDNINEIIDTVNNNELKEVLMTLEKKLEIKHKKEEKREIAKKMKDKGIDIEIIIEITELNKEEIEKL